VGGQLASSRKLGIILCAFPKGFQSRPAAREWKVERLRSAQRGE
jgi:hypothetical protein